MTGPESVLAFWFAGGSANDADLGPHLSRWFGRDAALDRSIAARFGAALEQAGRGELDGWAQTARGRLALIILLDQFSRNVFRDSGRAFAFDAQAARLCIEGLERSADHDLRPVERLFFYLPLLHSERAADHARGVACFARLAAEATGPQQHHFIDWLRIARRSRRVIGWFGRYPHRNAVLGRRSSVPERLFLLRGPIRRAGGWFIRLVCGGQRG